MRGGKKIKAYCHFNHFTSLIINSSTLPQRPRENPEVSLDVFLKKTPPPPVRGNGKSPTRVSQVQTTGTGERGEETILEIKSRSRPALCGGGKLTAGAERDSGVRVAA